MKDLEQLLAELPDDSDAQRGREVMARRGEDMHTCPNMWILVVCREGIDLGGVHKASFWRSFIVFKSS